MTSYNTQKHYDWKRYIKGDVQQKYETNMWLFCCFFGSESVKCVKFSQQSMMIVMQAWFVCLFVYGPYIVYGPYTNICLYATPHF